MLLPEPIEFIEARLRGRRVSDEDAWACWCDYKYSDMRLNDIVAQYNVCIPTVYNLGERFGDHFRRGRGFRKPCPLSKTRMRQMYLEYMQGDIPLHELEKKYGVAQQWLYKHADDHGRGRRRTDRSPRLWKRKLTPDKEREAWAEYENVEIRVATILAKYGLCAAILYDIGDRLGSTFRRHKSISGDAVKQRWRYLRNHRGTTEAPAEVPICSRCQKRPVQIWKWGLCETCYKAALGKGLRCKESDSPRPEGSGANAES